MTRLGGIISFAFLLTLGASTLDAAPGSPDPAGLDFFEAKIRPLLSANCYACHSAKSEKLKGNLHLDSKYGILKGGESGAPAIVPGDPNGSPLINAVRYEDEALQMPPKKKLAADQIAHLEEWVKLGAPIPDDAAPTASATTKPTRLSLDEGRKFWSFQKPREPKVPTSQPWNWARSDIDRFIGSKLAKNKLSPSPQADRRTLIRRATFDLIGLPPTPKEIDAFVSDVDPKAYEKLIDRLLTSPHYGERWGRYWLDVARYADTKGYLFEEERRYPFSYTYRDWVIRAFNEDLPYNQFLIYQIAADRVAPTTAPTTAPVARTTDSAARTDLAALGFLTLGRRFLNNQPDIIDDRIDVVTRGAMALTVSCARCHDHKYDPIPTADYYSLYGVFASTREPAELPLIGGATPAQISEYEAELRKRQAELDDFTNKRFAELSKLIRTRKKLANYILMAQKTVTPQPIGEEFEVPDDAGMLNPWLSRRWEAYLKKDNPVFTLWRRFAALPTTKFEVSAKAIVAELTKDPSLNPLLARFFLAAPAPKSLHEVADRYAAALVEADREKPHTNKQLEPLRLVLRGDEAPTNVKPEDARLLLGNVDRSKRRQLKQKIDELTATHPGSPERAMAVEDAPAAVEPTIFIRGNAANPGKAVPRQFPAILSSDNRKPFTQGSGRLELAKAIASQDNPLTGRVLVNRVWMYHFGKGLVRTPSDFGVRGEPPTHPELLDYLALRFTSDDNWSIKKLHKRIMLSATYQQQSIDNPAAHEIDPDNKLLWRQNPRRLDFEAMRDSLLASSGQLDLTLGGKPIDITAQPFIPRRSIYAFIDRQNLPGMFRTFDFASPDSTSAQRFNTSVPQQALFMMNSPFVIEQAQRLAARSEIKDQSDAAKRIEVLYRTTIGRAPTTDERDLAARFIAAEESQPKEETIAKPTPWKYGYGEFDETAGRLKNFYPFAHFAENMWRPSEKKPDPTLGYLMLTASGGHPGGGPAHAAVRRFVAPRDCTVSVAGTVSHNGEKGDGIRARLISSSDGLLATWMVARKSADTRLAPVTLKQGETLDFAVDSGRASNADYDSFNWTITLTKEPAPTATAGDDNGSVWNSSTEFAGPAPKPPTPLTPLEKLAQVLLQSNEFAFVD
jgi:hypothetical protein